MNPREYFDSYYAKFDLTPVERLRALTAFFVGTACTLDAAANGMDLQQFRSEVEAWADEARTSQPAPLGADYVKEIARLGHIYDVTDAQVASMLAGIVCSLCLHNGHDPVEFMKSALAELPKELKH